jgi:hypothetical protein
LPITAFDVQEVPQFVTHRKTRDRHQSLQLDDIAEIKE